MAVNEQVYKDLVKELDTKNITLVAVSKTKPVEDILALYQLGQRDFGENYVQELLEKESLLPKEIRWHFIGHLQSNKVKYIAPFVHLIHGIDSLKLLKEVNKQGLKHNKTINCLLQVHIAMEETKFGFDETELEEVMHIVNANELSNVKVCGLMGMASFTENTEVVRSEFAKLKLLFDTYPQFEILSMGMSGDYTIAIEEGSNLVRIGSMLFGARDYNKQ